MFNTIGIIIIIVIIYLVLVFGSRKTESELMHGFWRADAEFCKSAELDAMIVYIADGSTVSMKRNGYLFAANSDGIILNNAITFKFSGIPSINPGRCESREYLVNIDWGEEEAPEFFPSQLDAFYYPNDGKLIFALEDTVHAILYKDYSMSDATNRIPKKLENNNPDDGEGDSIEEDSIEEDLIK